MSLILDLNTQHLEQPVPGDFWHERYSLYHVVLEVYPNGEVLIAERDRSCTDGQIPDFDNPKRVTKEEQASMVRYEGTGCFIADVITNSKYGRAWVEHWQNLKEGPTHTN